MIPGPRAYFWVMAASLGWCCQAANLGDRETDRLERRACDRAADKRNHSQNPVAPSECPLPRSGVLRNCKFRLQAYWAETRTPGAGSVPRARGGGPGFWPLSVLGLNSEPVSKKKNGWKGSLTFWKLQNKTSFGKEALSLQAFLLAAGAGFASGCYGPPPNGLNVPLPVGGVCGGRWLAGAGGVNTLVRAVGLTRKLTK